MAATRTDTRLTLDIGYQRVKRTRHGLMLYSTNDSYIGKALDKYGEWCWKEIEEAQHYVYGLVLDVGANIGTHTLTYARRAQTVIAFEPQEHVFHMLGANLALNQVDNVHMYCMAVGDIDGTIPMQRIDYRHTGNFGNVPVGVGSGKVQSIRIDSLNLEPAFIKVDVEGFETQVILGARETIKRCHPILYVENDRPGKQEDLQTLIESLGYACTWHQPFLYNRENFYGDYENIFGGIRSEMMLCLPH